MTATTGSCHRWRHDPTCSRRAGTSLRRTRRARRRVDQPARSAGGAGTSTSVSLFPQIATVEAGARPAPAPPPLLTATSTYRFKRARIPARAGLGNRVRAHPPIGNLFLGRRRCSADVSDAHACSQHTQPALTPVLKWRDPTSRDDADTAHRWKGRTTVENRTLTANPHGSQ